MNIQATGFAADMRYGGAYGANIIRYIVDIVSEARSEGVQAAISGKVPLFVSGGSDVHKELDNAMVKRTPVSVTIGITPPPPQQTEPQCTAYSAL